MECPACQVVRSRVVDSRQADDGRSIRRRRVCDACGHRFTTFERVEVPVLQVRKQDGGREAFDPSKIAAGVAAACKGRPVPPPAVAQLVHEVEQTVRITGPEVSSKVIGQEVLVRLRVLDEVAAVRFASVLKGFSGVEDFAREISLLTGDADSAGTADRPR